MEGLALDQFWIHPIAGRSCSRFTTLSKCPEFVLICDVPLPHIRKAMSRERGVVKDGMSSPLATTFWRAGELTRRGFVACSHNQNDSDLVNTDGNVSC